MGIKKSCILLCIVKDRCVLILFSQCSNAEVAVANLLVSQKMWTDAILLVTELKKKTDDTVSAETLCLCSLLYVLCAVHMPFQFPSLMPTPPTNPVPMPPCLGPGDQCITKHYVYTRTLAPPLSSPLLSLFPSPFPSHPIPPSPPPISRGALISIKQSSTWC